MKGRWMTAMAAAYAIGAPCNAQEALVEGDIVGAVLLNGRTVAVAEKHRVHLISMTRTASRISVDGPFTRVQHIGRAVDGELVVWDDSLWAAFVFADDGDERRTVAFSKPGIGGGEVNFVALLADDVGVFSEADPGNPFSPTAGSSRNPVWYTTYARDGTKGLAWQALGRERVVHQVEGGMSSAPVIFGYDVIAAPIDGDRFVVAQTEGAAAVVVGPDGTRVSTVPMPPIGPTMSQDQIEQERTRLIATYDPGRLPGILSTILPEARVREAVEGMRAGRLEALRAAPANSVPPRISDLRVDSNGRVWMRRFVPPGDTLAVWEIRSVDGGGHGTVELPTNWVLYDATATRILVGVRDADGLVTRVVLVDRSS